MRYRWILLVLLLAGCGGGGGGNEGNAPPPVARFAFVANLGSVAGGGELSAFTVNATTGQLRHNGYVVTASGGGLTGVAVDPSNRFVYTINTSGVWAYSINAATGALSLINGSPVKDSGANPAGIAVDPQGRFVFVANLSGGVSVYTINGTTGALATVGASPFAAGTNPTAVSVDPSGRFVYVANQTSGTISQFSVNATGTLTPITAAAAAGTTPLGIGVEPSGRFVYVALRGAATANVLGYTIGADGSLTAFASGPVSAGSTPRSVRFDPSGRFVYVANETSADVSVFKINANGVLSPVGSPAATQGSVSWTAAVEPSGKFAYAVNEGSADVVLFTVNASDGTLSKAGSTAARFSPGALAFSRGASPVSYTPRFAYTANLNSNDISAFRIDAGSGALTLIGTPVASGGTNPFPVAADPRGRFLYVGHQGTAAIDTTVAAFTIDASSGALTAVGTPLATGGINADGLTVDPSGRFVYTGNVKDPESNSVSPFAINSSTGALTAIGTPAASGGQQPFSPAVDPSGKFLYTANFASANVSGFLINPATGTLSAVALQPFALTAASGPFSLVVSPSGRFVYVANQFDPNNVGKGNVSVFAINLVNGSLSQISGSPYAAGAGPRSIAVHPSGRFIYVGNENDSTVTAYQISDPSTGVLTLVTGSPFSVGGALRPITVDPSGKFLYAGRTGAAGVSAFPIDTTTGALGTIIGGAPVPTGDGSTTGVSPFGITTSGTIQ